MTPAERRAYRELERRAARLEPGLRAAILDAFRRLSRDLDLGAIEAALRDGDLDAVVRTVLPPTAVAAAFYGTRKILRDGVATAANATIRNTPSLRRLNIRFDELSPNILQAVRTIETGSLGFLQGETRAAVRDAVTRMLEGGLGPRQIARSLNNVIGLTPHQLGIIGNFRDALEAGDAGKALGYTLRDKRFDAQLRKLADTDTPLTPEQIERMTDGYTRKYRAYNAEVHARTAALESQRIGNQTAWKEAASELGPDVVVVKRWNATLDSRTREEHAAMNGDTAILDGVYRNGDSYPGESSPWNCRCVETYAVRKASESTIPRIAPAAEPVLPSIPNVSAASATGPAQPVTLESFITGAPSPARGYVAGVDLTGIKPQAVAEILRGLDAVLTPVGIKVDGISVAKMRGAAAMYTHSRSLMFKGGEFRTITFAKGQTNKAHNSVAVQRSYEARQAKAIAVAEARLADPNYPARLRALEQERLELLRVPTRWTVGGETRIFSNAAHEAGHAILFKNQALRQEWANAVKNIPKREWLRVSEYGAKNYDELWAEITTLRALNRASEVPAELLRLYEGIHSKIRGLP